MFFLYKRVKQKKFLALLSTAGVSVRAGLAVRELLLYLSVSHVVGRTYVGLQHRVVLLLGTQGLLQHSDVLLVVLVLLLQRFHLGRHLHDFLFPTGNLHTHVVKLMEEGRFWGWSYLYFHIKFLLRFTDRRNI